MVTGDVSDRETHAQAVRRALTAGELTGWVNCAAIQVDQSAEEIDEATVRRQLNVKLRTASAHPQLAVEYGPRGIRANTILPGAIRTRMCTDDWARSADPAAAQAADEAMHLQHRMGEPAEIAAVVSFLLSAESSLVNGQEIVADGGATARRPAAKRGFPPVRLMLLDANVATADGATGRLLLAHRATQAIGDPKASTNSASVFASINGQRKQDA